MDKVHHSWKKLFDTYDFELEKIYDAKDTVYPEKQNVFNAFLLPVDKIKVVLLAQDCYHDGSANGYCFSCDFKIPPSLRNIYKELSAEFPERNYKFDNGNIKIWSTRENIFLLNCALTVKKGEPLSHMDIWKEFTDDVIKYIDEHNKNCIYVLLGNFAKSKKVLITNKANIIEGVHPSPFSAHHGFFGSNVFKKIEEKLGTVINWSIC
jgi:uracil-DNA glycosylase